MSAHDAGGAGGNSPVSISRAAFDQMNDAGRTAHIRAGGRVHNDPQPPPTTRTLPAGTVWRSAFDAMPYAERSAWIAGGGKVAD